MFQFQPWAGNVNYPQRNMRASISVAKLISMMLSTLSHLAVRLEKSAVPSRLPAVVHVAQYRCSEGALIPSCTFAAGCNAEYYNEHACGCQ